MSNSSSYDMAFELCQILRKHKNELSEHEDLIIYPSSWFDKYFEIIFRDKNYSTNKLDVDLVKVHNLIKNDLENEKWIWERTKDVILTNDNEEPKQYNLQFKYVGEN